ncbi:hypothetical protein DFH09DRAFT_411877 [Mycena vulgaris]|nr:hypothetical protein DFH09DRAFT_411877 [Mycena vulgaris]
MNPRPPQRRHARLLSPGILFLILPGRARANPVARHAFGAASSHAPTWTLDNGAGAWWRLKHAVPEMRTTCPRCLRHCIRGTGWSSFVPRRAACTSTARAGVSAVKEFLAPVNTHSASSAAQRAHSGARRRSRSISDSGFATLDPGGSASRAAYKGGVSRSFCVVSSRSCMAPSPPQISIHRSDELNQRTRSPSAARCTPRPTREEPPRALPSLACGAGCLRSPPHLHAPKQSWRVDGRRAWMCTCQWQRSVDCYRLLITRTVIPLTENGERGGRLPTFLLASTGEGRRCVKADLETPRVWLED